MPESTKRRADATRDAALRTGRLDAALGFRVRLLEQLVARAFGRHFDVLGMTPTLYSILVLIEDNPRCRQTDLANALKMHQPNLVERVGLLIERGLIARREDASDRRANVLELTLTGQQFMDRVADAQAAVTRDLKESLGEDVHAALLELMPAAVR
ncbi:MAG: MarR family transcriptional regulator [Phenylobacterium sp.]